MEHSGAPSNTNGDPSRSSASKPSGAPKPSVALRATPARIAVLGKALNWQAQDYEHAFELTGYRPSTTQWLNGIDLFLRLLGCALILAGIAAFFAFNWASMHHFAKFAVLQLVIIASIFASSRLPRQSLAGQCCLFSGAFCTGILIAVFGQTYQTGADHYGLFLLWALLITPWVWIGRQSGLWLLWLLLLNLTLITYWTEVFRPPWDEFARIFGPLFWLTQSINDSELALLLVMLNGIALLVWEVLANHVTGQPSLKQQHYSGALANRWFPRIIVLQLLLIVTAHCELTLITHWWQDGSDIYDIIFFVIYGLMLGIGGWYYQYRQVDLLILSAAALSLMITSNSLLARLGSNEIEMGFFLSLLVIAETTGAALWLKQVSKRQNLGVTG
ncbi:multipass membrane protein [Oleiphilus messinensis]|uniref:Multipass membrane protein n=1 Tax=Oleiphilus messinensis TaxID=141451 RepID=A0A1Y0IFQ5_9GAMM|nr:DUF2157 domain-containing protein [Oleiphilus messinensis]ARU59338.1 multipass membrane protein [Oleiphilus messinensis]